MAALLVLIALVALPLLVGVVAIAVWLVDAAWTHYGNRKWRAEDYYVPSRVWIDGRYGDPDGDATRRHRLPAYVPAPSEIRRPRGG